MAVTTFASIYVGSYEVTLKVFELNQKKRPHQIDDISTRINIGKDIYQKGTVGYEVVDELCEVLKEFKQIMAGYQVADYCIYATTGLRDVTNRLFVLNQIKLRTGFDIHVISNSEHRLLSYKAVTAQEAFERMIQTSAAVADVGGDSIQITLFEKGELLSTQRIEVGTMRLLSLLNRPGITQERYCREIEEYINKNFDTYSALYMNGKVDSLIIMSNFGTELEKNLQGNGKTRQMIKAEKFISYIEEFRKKTLLEITSQLNLSDDQDPLILPAILMFQSLAKHMGPKEIWFPGVDINDGIAYDYAQRNQLIRSSHDLDKDVLSAAHHLAEHYHSFTPHVEALQVLSTTIFDMMKKIHGLTPRYRLLLQVAALLHDVGKYVSFSQASRCALEIIQSSEIIGLSHVERKIIAWSVYYNSEELDDYEELEDELDQESYLAVAKLSAILRVANALDQSHRQKFKTIRVSVKDRQLIITVEAYEDISLEQVLFESKTTYFEDVFSMKPVLKEKRVYNLESKKK